ncbi:unnamed protein product, partial [Didymodactylos carnosus]
NSCLLKDIIEMDETFKVKEIESVDSLNEVLKIVVGDYTETLYYESFDDEEEGLCYRNDETVQKHKRKKNAVLNARDGEQGGNLPDNDNTDNETEQLAIDTIYRDLFLWAILMKRIDMAKVSMAHMKNRICAALIATKILKYYLQIAPYNDIKDEYRNAVNYFEHCTTNCLELCHENDPKKANELTIRQIDLFGGVTYLQRMIFFIDQSNCLQALHNIWYDKIYPDQSKKHSKPALVFGFITRGLLAPALIRFRQQRENTQEKRVRRFKKNGISYNDPYELTHSKLINNRYFNKILLPFIHFHQALQTKFLYHCVQYIYFVLLFSYVLLFKFEQPTNGTPAINWTEILLYIMGSYASQSDSFYAARIVMAYDLEIWILRSLSFINVIPFLGSYLVANGKMPKDLLFFMILIGIVMTAYGVTSRSMFIDKLEFTGREIFRKIACPVYYLMFGNVGDELSYLDCK